MDQLGHREWERARERQRERDKERERSRWRAEERYILYLYIKRFEGERNSNKERVGRIEKGKDRGGGRGRGEEKERVGKEREGEGSRRKREGGGREREVISVVGVAAGTMSFNVSAAQRCLIHHRPRSHIDQRHIKSCNPSQMPAVAVILLSRARDSEQTRGSTRFKASERSENFFKYLFDPLSDLSVWHFEFISTSWYLSVLCKKPRNIIVHPGIKSIFCPASVIDSPGLGKA